MVGGLRPIYLSGDRIESGGAKSSHPPMNSGIRPQIRLPPNADAKVQLSTVSGKLNGKSVGIGKFTDASFGKGTVAMNIHTVSGSVEAQPGK